MKILKSLAAVAAAAALTVSGAAYYAPAVAPDTIGVAIAADDNNDDWLHAKGSRLYDMNGNEVWLTGANWFGLNCTENVPHGLYARDVDDLLKSVADHGINIIRFPISTELLLSWMDGKPLPVSSEPFSARTVSISARNSAFRSRMETESTQVICPTPR